MIVARRNQRGETVYEPLKLLGEMRPARAAIVRACADVRPASETYHALSDLLDAMDKLAKQLGHAGHFLAELHRTP